jgi:transcriptional regulator GlxA family with amidase domain
MDAAERRRPEYRARVHRVMDYIEAHLDESLTVEAVASAA